MSIVRSYVYQDAIKDFAQEIRSQMFTGNLGGLQRAIERLLDSTINQGRGGDVVDAVEQGLVADGTTDNSLKLQELVDDLGAAGGGIIRFPAGTYKFESTIDINKYSYIAIIGEGIDKTILDFTFMPLAAPSAFIQPGDYNTFSGFTLLGPARLSGSQGINLGNTTYPANSMLIYSVKVQDFDYGMVGQNGQNLIMYDIYVNDCANAGIGIGDWVNALIENVFIDGAQDWGLYVSKPWTTTPQNIHLRNIHIKNTNGTGLYWTHVTGGSAQNIYIENCAQVRDCALSVSLSTMCKFSEIYIKDTPLVGAIFLSCNGMQVQNMWVEDSLGDNYRLTNMSPGCVFTSCSSGGAGGVGFKIANTRGMVMSGIEIYDTTGNDMELTAPIDVIIQGLDTDSNGHTKIDHPEYITFVGDDVNSPTKLPQVEGIKNFNSDISNGVPAVKAEGTLSFTGMPLVGETFNINGQNITLVSNLTWYDQVVIGVDLATTVYNIQLYFNTYSTQKGNVEALSNGVNSVKFTWKTGGAAGNAIVFTEALTNCTADGGGTLGGTTLGVDELVNFIAKSDGEVKFKKISSSGGGGGNAPLPSSSDMILVWTDTDDSKIYLVINDGGVAKKTQFV